MSAFQPWFAVTMVELAQLASLGLQPEAGVEMQVSARAKADGKRIEGLETVSEQLSLLAGMSMSEQRDFVESSLEEFADAPRELDVLVQAWTHGDAKAIDAAGVDAFRAYPALHRRLVTDRNRRWVGTLARLLDERDDYFVAVGVLHLVGRDSVVELLQQRGYTVVQQ
jgi:uncharacterized protein YbaP (TraB family)